MPVAEMINIKDEFLDNFSTLEVEEDNSFFDNMRADARKALEHLEFPTSRDEYWKYTRVNGLLKKRFVEAETEHVSTPESMNIDDLDAYLITFVNGKLQEAPDQTDFPKGTIIKPLSEAKLQNEASFRPYFGNLANAQDHPFTALNSAYHADGVFVQLNDNVVLEKPLRILHITTGENKAFQPRNLFQFGKHAQAQVIFSYEALDSEESFCNSVSEVILQDNANIDFSIIQNAGVSDTYIDTTEVYQHENSTFSIHTVTLSGGLMRNNLNISVDGTNCETNLNGLYLTKGRQHVDNHTMVDHKKPHCNSNEMYKGIINEKSTGVFNGKVFVRQDAQKINAFQSNQNILLTDDASVNSKPELEIYADDVKCSHGSTTGQMDDEAIFYLRSRGIGEASAKKLMIQAFAADVLNAISVEPIRHKIQQYIIDRYDQAL